MTDSPELGPDAIEPAPSSAADAAAEKPKRPAARRPATPRATTPRKRPATTKTPAEGAEERPKRTRKPTAAAQSSPDTVRAPRGKARARQPVAEAAPDEDDTTTKLLLPAAIQPDDEHATTKLLPPARPVQDDDPTEILSPARAADDQTTELVPPVTPARTSDDETTELVHPARRPLPADDETTELVASAAHVRRGDDETTELLHTGPQVQAAPAVAEPRPEQEPEQAARPEAPETVLQVRRLSKRFGTTLAVDGIDLDVQAGSFAGIVGPNGAGKTTTLSMVTGLLRPDAGTVQVHGIDVWRDPERAKRTIGVLPDALRLFDRLTGAQLLYYSGVLRGLDATTVKARSADLVQAFGLEDATGRIVADYSAGMTKKIALAAAMIHSPRLLVLDEPFESVDPVSAANIIEILQKYVASGGTVVLSSHGMDLIQRVCDHVSIVVGGRILASGTTDEVRAGRSLEDRFVELAGGRKAAKGMEWLHSFTD